MEYDNSKKLGDIGEAEILKRIETKYPKAFIDNTGKANSDWDIWIPEIHAGIEVKMDYKSKETGNLVIEVMMNDKLSAVSVTKAKYFIFVTGYHYIWITPLSIYRFIEQHFEYGRVPFTGDGDNKSKLAYLVKLKIFKEYVNKLDKEQGWSESIKENDKLHYSNLDNLIKEIKEYE